MHSMSQPITRSLLLAVMLVAPACILTPEIIGETLTTAASGENDDSATSVDEPSTTGTAESTSSASVGASSTSAAPQDGAYGSACTIEGLNPNAQFSALTQDPACDGGICLVVNNEAAPACDGDPDCIDQGEGATCGENGICHRESAFIEENTHCTQTCEVAEDCPAIPGCMTGVSCSVFSLLDDELCCKKICACNDRLDFELVKNFETACIDNPGMCG